MISTAELEKKIKIHSEVLVDAITNLKLPPLKVVHKEIDIYFQMVYFSAQIALAALLKVKVDQIENILQEAKKPSGELDDKERTNQREVLSIFSTLLSKLVNKAN